MMCDDTTAVDRAVAHCESSAVHTREAEARIGTAFASGSDDRRRAVVDPDDEPVGVREPRGLFAHTASDVEDHTRAETRRDLAVPGIVQREQRVGGRARHRTLTGEPGHGPPLPPSERSWPPPPLG